jgi:hypothetical protein
MHLPQDVSVSGLVIMSDKTNDNLAQVFSVPQEELLRIVEIAT